ncbi:hypothetical protein BDK51DRAFT_50823 [Blyttiomyces helicus]|uniref:Uncharacterized protein n=1 Tax=Blyttiomyces helicus TaxID=388810 RepID=A0A4P9WJR1_9FUNG|nr:hypothetical protein BDK51DRAFT_50823 [Blyttiomyces helicus]|eukprot:RKO92622.1 hypothetical protein BDK51DRAFT_50823 [Blyttiomyces helicus]
MQTQINSDKDMKAFVEWVWVCVVLHSMLADLGDAWSELSKEEDVELPPHLPPEASDVDGLKLGSQLGALTLADFKKAFTSSGEIPFSRVVRASTICSVWNLISCAETAAEKRSIKNLLLGPTCPPLMYAFVFVVHPPPLPTPAMIEALLPLLALVFSPVSLSIATSNPAVHGGLCMVAGSYVRAQTKMGVHLVLPQTHPMQFLRQRCDPLRLVFRGHAGARGLFICFCLCVLLVIVLPHVAQLLVRQIEPALRLVIEVFGKDAEAAEFANLLLADFSASGGTETLFEVLPVFHSEHHDEQVRVRYASTLLRFAGGGRSSGIGTSSGVIGAEGGSGGRLQHVGWGAMGGRWAADGLQTLVDFGSVRSDRSHRTDDFWVSQV